MANNEKIIGRATIAEAFDYSVPQEFAGACETVRVEAGSYPIVQCRNSYGQYYYGVRLNGIKIYSGWFGTNTRVTRPNTPSNEFAQYYDYQIAMAAIGMMPLCVGRVNGKPLFANVELLNGVTAERSGTIAKLVSVK